MVCDAMRCDATRYNARVDVKSQTCTAQLPIKNGTECRSQSRITEQWRCAKTSGLLCYNLKCFFFLIMYHSRQCCCADVYGTENIQPF